MKWSILVLTMPQRQAMLDRLLNVLRPQLCEGIELLIRTSDATLPIGENREVLRQQAKGEYLSFVDDDDLVSAHLVKRVFPLLDGVDYIGFNLEQRVDGEFACIERRSLEYANRVWQHWMGDRFRDISHLNPMRRELALQVPMAGWPGEDNRWADAIRALDIVKTEHYLDETLYYYLMRTSKPEFEAMEPYGKNQS